MDAASLQKDGGNYKYIDTTVKNNYGKGYIYSVAVDSNGSKLYDTVGLALYRLKAPTIISVTQDSSGSVTVTWAKEDCHGYEIQYSQDNGKTWIKAPMVNSGSTVKLSISGLSSGKEYVFRIRCQKTNGDRGTIWSPYSPWTKTNVT